MATGRSVLAHASEGRVGAQAVTNPLHAKTAMAAATPRGRLITQATLSDNSERQHSSALSWIGIRAEYPSCVGGAANESPVVYRGMEVTRCRASGRRKYSVTVKIRE
jgi:hypothetical protein